MTDHITFDRAPTATFAVDSERRTITGLAVPAGAVAESNGRKISFAAGSLKAENPQRVKLLMGHNWDRAVGHLLRMEDTEAGIVMTFRVARGASGDEALTLAEDGAWDGLSVGVGEFTEFEENDDVIHVLSAPLYETSLTPIPAFDDARVTAVAASKQPSKDKESAPMADEIKPDAVVTLSAADLSTAFADAIKATQPALNPAAALDITSAPLYRFDGIRGDYDLSTDIIAAQHGDSEAKGRLDTFMQSFAEFAIVGNAALNPSAQRPEMYVDQLDFTRPLFDRVNKGTLSDATPFIVPKFVSSSDLVAPHVSGVAPGAGSLEVTSQTITPSAVSGRVEIPREMFDQGGSPQLSGIIWRQMVRAYYEALEARVATLLNAGTYGTITLTAGETDADLVNELEAEIALLQFVRGGFRFDGLAAEAGLYTALAAAADTTGRKLLPISGATNSNGGATSRFQTLDVAGVEVVPSHALGATVGTAPASSFLFSNEDVHAWASAPSRLDFQYRVEFVDIAIWGYVATAITRTDGVREVIYDPAA